MENNETDSSNNDRIDYDGTKRKVSDDLNKDYDGTTPNPAGAQRGDSTTTSVTSQTGSINNNDLSAVHDITYESQQKTNDDNNRRAGHETTTKHKSSKEQREMPIKAYDLSQMAKRDQQKTNDDNNRRAGHETTTKHKSSKEQREMPIKAYDLSQMAKRDEEKENDDESDKQPELSDNLLNFLNEINNNNSNHENGNSIRKLMNNQINCISNNGNENGPRADPVDTPGPAVVSNPQNNHSESEIERMRRESI